jgi:5-methylcytosine-specific restriction enzyme subunit McrC
MVVDRTTGHGRFHDPLRDEARMGALFESFVFHFYRKEQDRATVDRPRIKWHDAHGSPEDLSYLPAMQTDVALNYVDRTLLIDTKFYAQALTGRFDGRKVRSEHLYQILSYLDNYRPISSRPVEGMLLYPAVGTPFRFDYVLNGRVVRVVSLDLAQEWEGIHVNLLSLVGQNPSPRWRNE